ncbi:MAG: hypothetical protein MJ103_04440 [Saccharofermentans sp.]|nr:hypothetical protein [Saccharofermentans sp.]
MIQLLAANFYRVLKDKRLFIVIIAHLLIYVPVMSLDYILPEIDYTGVGSYIMHAKETFTPNPGVYVLSHQLGTADILIATLVYTIFYITDNNRDRTFAGMCTIYKDRSKVLLSDYITLGLIELVFAFSKVVGAMTIQLMYGRDFILVDSDYNYIGFIVWLFFYMGLITVFYSLYIITRKVYLSMMIIFVPLTISSASRFMMEIPFGEILFSASVLFLVSPRLIYSISDWQHALYVIIPVIVSNAIFITISCILVNKRDVY